MKTILIATDFSEASRNASLYGLQLAKALNANVILFTAYHVSNPPAALNVTISRYSIMKQTEKRLEDEAERIGYIDMPKLTTICDEGVAEEVIINIANEKKADLIIAGMKGIGKDLKKIFGSTATSLAKNANIPVIIVPENARFKSLDTIVLAIDNTANDNNIIGDLLILIAKIFKSKLHLVKVINTDEERMEVSDTLEKFKNVLQITNTSFEYIAGKNIGHALNEFINTHHADMLVMTPHKHEWMEHLFKKSETKDMIFHTHLPLLVLPEKRV